MMARSFPLSILTVAVLAAAPAASGAIFADDAYMNSEHHDRFDRFSVVNKDFTENCAVALGESASLAVTENFLVDVTRTTLAAGPLAGVAVSGNAPLSLSGTALISVKNLAAMPSLNLPEEGEVQTFSGKAPATYGLVASGSTVTAENLGIVVEGPIETAGATLDESELNVKTLVISAKADAEPTTVGLYDLSASGLTASASTIAADRIEISASSVEKATGLALFSSTLSSGVLSVDATSAERAATAIEIGSEELNSNTTLTLTGTASLKAAGTKARGLTVNDGKVSFNGAAVIEASATQEAYSIWAGSGSLVTFKDKAFIKAESADKSRPENARAVFVDAGTVVFYKGATIVSDGYAVYADNNSNFTLLSANDASRASGEEWSTTIVGDIYSGGSGVNIILSGNDSLTGASEGNGNINIKLSDGAAWTVTGPSKASFLSSSSGRLYFASDDASLEAGTLSLSGTTVVGMQALPSGGRPYIQANLFLESAIVRVEMSGDFNDARTINAAEAVKAAADAVFGEENSDTVSEVVLAQGRLEGAVEATRNADGSFEIVQKRNTKIDGINTLAVLSAVRWRHDVNDLEKRMGALRTSPAGTGGWARIYGSELSYGGADAKNNSVQAGVDTDLAGGWKAGAAFTYTDVSSEMTGAHADSTGYELAAYAVWMDDNGHYLDLIAKASRLTTDFNVSDIGGGFDNNAWSLSAEYGRTFEFACGAFIEPQAGFAWGRLTGDDFVNSEGVSFAQDDFESLIARLGLRTGFHFPHEKGLVYLHASVGYDFKGETGSVASLGTKSVRLHDDIGGTLGEVGMGANFNLTNATHVYVDLEKSTGGDASEKWRWSVGVRHAY